MAVPKDNPPHENQVRLRPGVWQKAAIDRGIRPSVRAISEASGISASSLYRVIHGSPPNGRQIAALISTLKLPFDDLFYTDE